jgi:hypothetical protein
MQIEISYFYMATVLYALDDKIKAMDKAQAKWAELNPDEPNSIYADVKAAAVYALRDLYNQAKTQGMDVESLDLKGL